MRHENLVSFFSGNALSVFSRDGILASHKRIGKLVRGVGLAAALGLTGCANSVSSEPAPDPATSPVYMHKGSSPIVTDNAMILRFWADQFSTEDREYVVIDMAYLQGDDTQWKSDKGNPLPLVGMRTAIDKALNVPADNPFRQHEIELLSSIMHYSNRSAVGMGIDLYDEEDGGDGIHRCFLFTGPNFEEPRDMLAFLTNINPVMMPLADIRTRFSEQDFENFFAIQQAAMGCSKNTVYPEFKDHKQNTVQAVYNWSRAQSAAATISALFMAQKHGWTPDDIRYMAALNIVQVTEQSHRKYFRLQDMSEDSGFTFSMMHFTAPALFAIADWLENNQKLDNEDMFRINNLSAASIIKQGVTVSANNTLEFEDFVRTGLTAIKLLSYSESRGPVTAYEAFTNQVNQSETHRGSQFAGAYARVFGPQSGLVDEPTAREQKRLQEPPAHLRRRVHPNANRS